MMPSREVAALTPIIPKRVDGKEYRPGLGDGKGISKPLKGKRSQKRLPPSSEKEKSGRKTLKIYPINFDWYKIGGWGEKP